MAGRPSFKLEKLKISAFKSADGTQPVLKPFEAMFNPASYKQSYAISWIKRQGINASGAQLIYDRSLPSHLELELVLDGTGVHQAGILALTRKTVQQRIDEFMALAFYYNGEIHEPNYLLVEWGKLRFQCRLRAVDVKYTAFNRDGTPLRAELSLRFTNDLDPKRRAKKDNKRSPDLTHSRVVRTGDTLPLLTREIYGSSARYLDVARFNQLDDFRDLIPGQQLLFPPLASFDGDAPSVGEG